LTPPARKICRKSWRVRKTTRSGKRNSNGLKEQSDDLTSRLDNIYESDGFHDAVVLRTAANVDSLQPSNISFSNPPTQAQLQAFQTWANALLAALKH
jgi:hypothetical protein